MEDHIFGTFSTDQLKFLHERASAMGVQHRARLLPLDPSPGEPFTLVVTSGTEFPARAIVACYTTDGSEPTLECTQLPFQRMARFWSTAAWGYVTEWHALVPPQSEGTLFRYRIAAQDGEGTWFWADWPQPKLAVEEVLVKGGESAPLRAEPGRPTDFAISIDHFAPPTWVQDAVIYQVFLDRFARDEDGGWPTPPSLYDLYGGTLRGVIRKLEHIASLGATCLWLSPLFPSPTHHGYDATDYFDVEPRYGTKDDLKELVQKAHTLGIRVLLDLICNHVCNEHPIFQKALRDPESEERNWFWIDPSYTPHGYRAFFSVETMPELNTDHPTVRDYLIRAAEMWLKEVDIDGFRLDYAHGPSHAFWADFWRAVKRAKPDAWCFGEVVDPPESQLSYVGYLDGVLDFHLGDALRRVFAYGGQSLLWFDGFLRDHDAFFPSHERFSRPTFLDNHDMDRFLFAAGGSLDRLKLATLVLYTLPQPPLLYYGTEIALQQRYGKSEGYGLEVSREPMAWELATENAELLRYFQRLGALRHSEPAMRPASRETFYVGQDDYLGRHERDGSEILVLLNRVPASTTIKHEALQGSFVDLLSEKPLALTGAVTLEGIEGRLLKRL
ncbi:MAG: alpha-amylase [Ardenticatenales bacterium]|nr:alpha-amylase [Ardenticatenales bacterium]